ncbi:MAG: alpha-galactosidase [Lachnospiraceae bacterium]|nr:alpha-galactosidase [Lachnospiraceae bacterium]
MGEKNFENPDKITDLKYGFDAFKNGKALFNKKKRLPTMGWNSWNAFGSGNTEALTKAMCEKIVELGLDKIGYKYVVLDDGCYNAKRVDGHLESDPVKFPSGFQGMSDFVHSKRLKFGMYNDIGSKLCSGLEVGTCGYEETDAKDYIKWDIDYIKVDNCYNVWDNATFSNPENARFTFAPNIRSIRINKTNDSGKSVFQINLSAVEDGEITGNRAFIERDYVTGIGTFDGTGPDSTPLGELSSELVFNVNVPEDGEYDLYVTYATGSFEGAGAWLQVTVGENGEYYYDDFLSVTENQDSFKESPSIKISLKAGENRLRLMNHRRQENTLLSYAKIKENFEKINPDKDIVFSICEWGKTQPQNWGYKVGDSWRILNDITFQVGSDGDSGHASWEGAYTTSVTAQYNKAVIMDSFSGPGKGYNDPDMLMIGMDGLNETMCKTHMTMWCMMNSPLMLGMDLRNVKKDDFICSVISNEDVIALDQDPLGIQAKRIYTTKAVSPDTTYLRDNDRIDVLCKPLADGSIALSFINVSLGDRKDSVYIGTDLIKHYMSEKMADPDRFFNADKFEITDLWTKEKKISEEKGFSCNELKACDNLTIRIKPL